MAEVGKSFCRRNASSSIQHAAAVVRSGIAFPSPTLKWYASFKWGWKPTKLAHYRDCSICYVEPKLRVPPKLRALYAFLCF